MFPWKLLLFCAFIGFCSNSMGPPFGAKAEVAEIGQRDPNDPVLETAQEKQKDENRQNTQSGGGRFSWTQYSDRATLPRSQKWRDSMRKKLSKIKLASLDGESRKKLTQLKQWLDDDVKMKQEALQAQSWFSQDNMYKVFTTLLGLLFLGSFVYSNQTTQGNRFGGGQGNVLGGGGGNVPAWAPSSSAARPAPSRLIASLEKKSLAANTTSTTSQTTTSSGVLKDIEDSNDIQNETEMDIPNNNGNSNKRHDDDCNNNGDDQKQNQNKNQHEIQETSATDEKDDSTSPTSLTTMMTTETVAEDMCPITATNRKKSEVSFSENYSQNDTHVHDDGDNYDDERRNKETKILNTLDTNIHPIEMKMNDDTPSFSQPSDNNDDNVEDLNSRNTLDAQEDNEKDSDNMDNLTGDNNDDGGPTQKDRPRSENAKKVEHAIERLILLENKMKHESCGDAAVEEEATSGSSLINSSPDFLATKNNRTENNSPSPTPEELKAMKKEVLAIERELLLLERKANSVLKK